MIYPGNISEEMNKMKDKLFDLPTSPLLEYRKENKYYPVLGEGSHDAKIMFIGEAPGKNEALSGRPFCGRAGKILDELLSSIGIKREDVYITNIVKDRPPENRDPTQEEINIYGPFLDNEIALIKPIVIATLGRFSMSYILDRLSVENRGMIGELHGHVLNGKTTYGIVKVVPLYHPAASIYNRSLRETLINDFKILKQIIS